MGHPRSCDSASTHLYTQHSSDIHSAHQRIGEHAGASGQFPASPTPALGCTSQAQPPLQHVPQRPALLLLHPLFQLARLDAPPPSAALPAPFPTVTVSPHYQSPTSERETTLPAVKKTFTDSTAARTLPDGKKSVPHGVHGSAPSMTSNGLHTMGGKREEKGTAFPRSQRPSIVSQHSNSVPSTPLQLARQYESRSRSPSPNGGLGSHSPRSVSSEANGAMPTLRAAKSNRCKYETNAAFGRRRIPYTSSDILEKAKEEPKKTLDPHEDEKLSGDMRELYDRLLPSQESTDRRAEFVKKLEIILHTEWPGNEFTVHVFGSSGNLLYTSESDGRARTGTFQ